MSYDNEKIDGLRLKMSNLRKQLGEEYDPNKKKRLQMEIKICELKIMISQIK